MHFFYAIIQKVHNVAEKKKKKATMNMKISCNAAWQSSRHGGMGIFRKMHLKKMKLKAQKLIMCVCDNNEHTHTRVHIFCFG